MATIFSSHRRFPREYNTQHAMAKATTTTITTTETEFQIKSTVEKGERDRERGDVRRGLNLHCKAIK